MGRLSKMLWKPQKNLQNYEFIVVGLCFGMFLNMLCDWLMKKFNFILVLEHFKKNEIFRLLLQGADRMGHNRKNVIYFNKLF